MRRAYVYKFYLHVQQSDEISTKLEQLQLRTYQANDAVASMKREAKEEREKIMKRQMELEVLIEVRV